MLLKFLVVIYQKSLLLNALVPTVASTMICAALADIPFFVTGGIGGVHKGAEETMDISADLDEFAKQMLALSVQALNQY